MDTMNRITHMNRLLLFASCITFCCIVQHYYLPVWVTKFEASQSSNILKKGRHKNVTDFLSYENKPLKHLKEIPCIFLRGI